MLSSLRWDLASELPGTYTSSGRSRALGAMGSSFLEEAMKDVKGIGCCYFTHKRGSSLSHTFMYV